MAAGMYAIDPPVLQRLLADHWPKLASVIPRARALGADWFRMSTPFVHHEGDVPVAHVGALEIPLVIDGRATMATGLHAVCTAAPWRGRGFSRALMERALAWADARSDTVVLHANDPALYERYGFRAVPQVVWTTAAPEVPRTRAMPVLSDRRPTDVATVFRAFAGRVPVADVLGVGEAAELFVLDEVLGTGGFARLWWSERLGCVIAAQIDEDDDDDGATDVLRIYDVVGPRWPSLAEIVAEVDGHIARVESFFAPERWPEHRWTTRPSNAPDTLMVRGRFTAATEVAVPPLARC